MMPNVGVWGVGVVGSNTARLFKLVANLFLYDKYKKEDQYYVRSSPKDVVINSDFLFVCLPTPMKESGEIDLSYIKEALTEIADIRLSCIVKNEKQIQIIRSTSVSGSSDRFANMFPMLNIAFVPEFLTERNPWEDTLNARRVIIGTNDAISFFAIKYLFRLVYDEDKVEFIHMLRSEAEMYKYACNYFLAMSVLAANELYKICEAAEVDYQIIQKNLRYDPRIGSFTKVPGFDGDFGVGGKCFPKDINGLSHLSKTKGYTPEFLDKAIEFNDKIRKNKDWLEIPGAVSDCKFEGEPYELQNRIYK